MKKSRQIRLSNETIELLEKRQKEYPVKLTIPQLADAIILWALKYKKVLP